MKSVCNKNIEIENMGRIAVCKDVFFVCIYAVCECFTKVKQIHFIGIQNVYLKF